MFRNAPVEQRLPAGVGERLRSSTACPCDAVSITGEVKYYDVTGDSGSIVQRGFCPTCGARLFGKAAIAADIIDIMVGSLDDPGWYRPQADVYTASAQPWDHMNPDLPKFPKLPPS